MRKTWTITAVLLCTAALVGWGWKAAYTVAGPATKNMDRLVVHEWGTFTSYSNTDGGRLEFRPLFDDDESVSEPAVIHEAMERSQQGEDE